MWGSSEIYNMGDPLPGMQNSIVPQYLRVLQDFMVELPYWEMEPANEAVSAGELEVDGQAWRTNFCAAKAGEVYLVYSEYGGAGRITLAGRGRYRVTRLNPRIGLRHDLGRVEAGPARLRAPARRMGPAVPGGSRAGRPASGRDRWPPPPRLRSGPPGRPRAATPPSGGRPWP